MSKLKENYTEKQYEVLKYSLVNIPKIMICSGAKRAGKTFILIQAFLLHMYEYKGMGVSFIIGGATSSSIQRNILDDLEQLVDTDIKLNRNGGFELWGNMVYCFGGANSDSWKSVRGFTAAGAFLNEGTALHDTFLKEVISRCSYKGARIFIDTNPENPMHSVKTDYIDNDGQLLSDGRVNIKAFDFTLYDNDKLPSDYIESIEKATPSGMFFDRDVLGKWVTAEGIVYKDFVTSKHCINIDDEIKKKCKRFVAGVDWGYEHHGIINLFGIDKDENVYLIEEYAEQHKEIDYWLAVAKDIKSRYGNILFWCDSARPEYVKRFQREGFKAKSADKSVLSGIESVASLIKQDKFYINSSCKRILKELMVYAWNEKTGDPIKVMDDSLDCTRYVIYNEVGKLKNKITVGVRI